jgi:hypothetical protein
MQGYVLTGLLSFEGLAERTRNGEQPGESERSLRSRNSLTPARISRAKQLRRIRHNDDE